MQGDSRHLRRPASRLTGHGPKHCTFKQVRPDGRRCPSLPERHRKSSRTEPAKADGQRGVPDRMATEGQPDLHHHPDGWCPGSAARTLRQPRRGRQSGGDVRPGGAPRRRCATLRRRRTEAPPRSGPKTCLTASS